MSSSSFSVSPLIAVITWITPKYWKGKVILLEIHDGEGLAMTFSAGH
jgi:hypothetical protein